MELGGGSGPLDSNSSRSNANLTSTRLSLTVLVDFRYPLLKEGA
jgi:hypothetical protein